MVLNSTVKSLRLAEELKQTVIKEMANPNSSNKSFYLSQLQSSYQSILLADLDYALDKKVEQDLWNFGFKIQIESLQNNARDKKNSRRSESLTLLSWVLQSAIGFYISFLHQICTIFKLELPFRFRFPRTGVTEAPKNKIRIPQLSSCWYICQYCLVHLGDLARYSRQPRRADSFYRQALNVSPRNGQPYNQLGLLRAARGDRLGAAYYHARGIAVGGPFPPAVNNLSRTLSAASTVSSNYKNEAKSNSKFESPEIEICNFAEGRLNSQSYKNNYITVHYKLQSMTDLDDAEECVSDLNSTLIALVATDEFDASTLIKMCSLDTFALYSITESHKVNEADLSEDEKKVFYLLMELIAGSFTALILPAHTRASEETLSYPALPAIKYLLEWIRLHPAMLKQSAFVSRPQLWPGLCTLLTNLQGFIKDFSGDQHKTIPLPEDEELQGFLPIDMAFSELIFNQCSTSLPSTDNNEISSNLTSEEINLKMAEVLQEHFSLKKKSWQLATEEQVVIIKDTQFYNLLRAFRLTKLSEWLLSYQKEIGTEYFTITEDSEKGVKIFSPIQNTIESNPDVLKTIQEISILREKRLNETHNQKNTLSVTTQDDCDISDSEHKLDIAVTKPQFSPEESVSHPIVISEADFKEKVREKRAGILKPQGSLEKARGEKALSRSCRIDVITPEPILKLSNEIAPDMSDIQDTGSSSSTVSQDGTICTDIGSLLDPPIFNIDKISVKKEGKKVRTNVAMQAIMRKQEESSKQVKFLTPATTPESITDPCNISPLETRHHIEKKKIIQPKVMKSLASLPIDRKAGGILSLKDKSAGYPHLVNVDTLLNENIKLESESSSSTVHEDISKRNLIDHEKTDAKVDVDDQSSKVKNVDNPNQNYLETNTKKPIGQKDNYTPWSDGNSMHSQTNKGDKSFSNSQYPNWKPEQGMQNLRISQNNTGCYSYFAQKPDAANITLPVVNPKEIDVRSAHMQRQKSNQQSANDNYYKYDCFPNVQYNDPNAYNCWQPYDTRSNLQDSKNPNNSYKGNNLPPRFANLYKNNSNTFDYGDKTKTPSTGFNVLEKERNFQSGYIPRLHSGGNQNVLNSQTGWWRNNKNDFDNKYQNLDYANPIRQPDQRVFNYQQGNINVQSSNINEQNMNFVPGGASQEGNYNMPSSSNPSIFPPPFNMPNNPNYNPYQQKSNYMNPNYNAGPYSNSPGMPQNFKPIGGEISSSNFSNRGNVDQFGMQSSMKFNKSPMDLFNADVTSVNSQFMKNLQPNQNVNTSHIFNAEIPEFVPRHSNINPEINLLPDDGSAKSVKSPSEATISTGTNVYSLFDGPESPWQAKNSTNTTDNAPQQSLWSGTGPSPLERLLEQQKQFK